MPLKSHYKATTESLLSNQSKIPCSLVCKYCNKRFNHRNNRLQHEKRCKVKRELETKKQEEEKEQEHKRHLEEKRLEIELKKQENERIRLQLQTDKSQKESAVTIQKINKALQLQNSNINSNNTVNTQNITNNYQIVALGKENIQHLLTDADKKMIINSKRFALQRLIELIHCGKFNQFRNVIISNIKDNYMYKFDDHKNMFSLVTKEDTLKTLLEYRLGDLELIYDQLVSDNKVDDKTKRCMERFINEMSDKEDNNYKYEINDIKMLLFNERDKLLQEIMDNISLVVSVNEV